MRKLLIVCITMTLALCVNAQSSQSIVTLKSGSVLKGFIKKIDPMDSLTMVISGKEINIKMSEVALVESSEEEKVIKVENGLERKIVKPYDPLDGYKGFLLDKGNNVFVYGDDSEYEEAGVNELRRLLILDGFWNVVDNINEAHFTLNYVIKKSSGNSTGVVISNIIVQERDPDKVRLSISSWRSNEAEFLKEINLDSPDSKRSAVLASNKLYYQQIVPLQKKIETGKLKKAIREKFIVK